MREACWPADDSTRLQLHPTRGGAMQQLRLRAATPAVLGLAGGTFKWGGSPLDAWYDWHLEFQMQCIETYDGDVARYGSQPTIACRTDRFKVEYGTDAIWATLSYEEDVVISGVGLRNDFQAQPRGEPLRWRFEVWCGGEGGGGGGDGQGRWEALLEVPALRIDSHVSAGVFYLPTPSRTARRFRFVFEEWWMPCPLLHLHSVVVLGWRPGPAAEKRPPLSGDTAGAAAGQGTRGAEAEVEEGGTGVGGSASGSDLALRFRELASVDLMLRRWKRPMRLRGYSLLPSPGGGGPGLPTSWVLEGLTDD
jgi:hypothetical protein